MIVYCIYTPTGKREDLWDAHVKRPSVFQCLSAYICLLAWSYISCMSKSVDKHMRLSEEIAMLFGYNLLIKCYSGDFGLL